MKISSYIKFLFTSTNAHGVHSPFVYNLVQKCFYAKNPQLPDKYSYNEQLLYRITSHFYPQTVYMNNTSVPEAKIFNSITKVVDVFPLKTSFAYLDYKQKAAVLNKFEQLLPTINNNTILILNHIHASLQMEDAWIIIKNHPDVTVTIDTFTWGFVFFRTEQQKEHFVIRTSKSKFTDFILGIPRLWGMLR